MEVPISLRPETGGSRRKRRKGRSGDATPQQRGVYNYLAPTSTRRGNLSALRAICGEQPASSVQPWVRLLVSPAEKELPRCLFQTWCSFWRIIALYALLHAATPEPYRPRYTWDALDLKFTLATDPLLSCVSRSRLEHAPSQDQCALLPAQCTGTRLEPDHCLTI
ncbi:hypothetical protein CC78DRAFT_536839 [Lojkania enalia]|uniref:Uncharacterized protein n=1 Tax=Lojkania enalia TaxID=147567 RepID=A0A9P4N2I4_9PLEO|nr:hypothetical protein CC78DRAFT_536839 [Didymosphaeria enalia]